MPFGLKNAGATYQRMMQACLKEKIGRNVQVYVDDIVIKTYKAATLLDDLHETFAALNKYRIKLNPKKCAFGVPVGKLLGYLVSARGIEANPEKVQAIARMQEPIDVKGVQQLTGRLAALSCFISRLGERTLPFYQLIRKGEKFEWTEEARTAFADLKKTLLTPSILAIPKEREKLYLYVAARSSVVSITLVVERAEEGKVQSIQRPIYYLSMLLTKSQQRYPHYQKLLLAIVMTSRKVSHYFDEHPITIVSSAPLADILNNPGATWRGAEWNIELNPRDLQFKHPTGMKAQVLPDFLVEWTEVQAPGTPDLSNSWTMFFDGSKRQQGAGAGVVLISPKGMKLKYVLQVNFSHASNNEAEYEALLHGMRMAKTCGATRLIIYGDSNLVVQQTMRNCDAIADNMAAYQKLYNALEGSFDGLSSTTSPGPTIQKLTSSQTSGRPEGQYHPASSSKASARDPSRCRQQHPRQSWTVKTQQTRHRWHQQVHQKAPAPVHRTTQLRQSSNCPSGKNSSFDS